MGRMVAQSERTKTQGHTVLLLSLNLILLAFFILLNALADYQVDRVRAVLESVDQTFSDGTEVRSTSDDAPGALGSLPRARDLLREIGSAFEAMIPAARSTVNAQATVLTVEFPANAVFLSGQARLRPAGGTLLRRLGGALSVADPAAGFTTTVEFYHPTAEVGADPALHIARAALVAQRLQARLAPGLVSVGLQPRPDDTVRFVLRLDRAVLTAPPPQARQADE